MTNSKDGADTNGTEEKPNSEGSQGTGQQGSSTDNVLAKQIAELSKQVDAMSRQFQSEKDRAVKNTNKRMDKIEGDLRTILQGYVESGKGNISDVLNDLDFQEQQEERQTLRDLASLVKNGKFSPSNSGGTGEGEGVDVSGIVKDLELNMDDNRVKAFMGRQFKNEVEATKEAAKLLKTIVTTQPSDADVPSEVAQRKNYATEQEKLMNEYTEGSKDLRGQALINYKMAMRKKGLRIS